MKNIFQKFCQLLKETLQFALMFTFAVFVAFRINDAYYQLQKNRAQHEALITQTKRLPVDRNPTVLYEQTQMYRD